MSIFSSIASAIFGRRPAAASASTASSQPAASPSATASTTTASPGAAKPMSRDELNGMIQKIADGQKEDLNWEESIVDLMKLLKLDSSLTARKQLAQELGYTGALDGSAAMNIWLHKQVMTKLAEGGGKVPDSLKHA